MHVRRGNAREFLEDVFEPGEVKEFAAGALRRFLREIGLRHEAREKRFIYGARRCPTAACVVGAFQVLGAPGVQKDVARAAVKAGDGTVALHRREERDVGNAADVDDAAGDVARKDLRVESGH